MSLTCCSWWNSQIPAANHANSHCAYFALCEAGDKPPTQANNSQFWFSQFMKCNFSNLAAATPDAMVDFPCDVKVQHQRFLCEMLHWATQILTKKQQTEETCQTPQISTGQVCLNSVKKNNLRSRNSMEERNQKLEDWSHNSKNLRKWVPNKADKVE